jgi:hypothetical protein
LEGERRTAAFLEKNRQKWQKKRPPVNASCCCRKSSTIGDEELQSHSIMASALWNLKNRFSSTDFASKRL